MAVLVVGARPAARSLAGHLPAGWHVRRADTATTTADADIMVLYGATRRTVSAARRGHPATSVLGVVSTADPVDVIVEVLEAGADACVRESSAAVIAGHLVACQRRCTARHAAA